MTLSTLQPAAAAARSLEVPNHSDDTLQLVKYLMNAGAMAMRLGGYCHQANPAFRLFGSVLGSVEDSLQKLTSAKKIAAALNISLKVFACTEAKIAVAIAGRSGAHDLRYLSGATTMDDLQAYCGGIDAAIARSLLYSSSADVLCYKSPAFNLLEARRFAAEIRTAYPTKQLAFCCSPRLSGERLSETDHAERERQLKAVGYSYYFYTQFGSIVFPHLPAEKAWVIFSDATQSMNDMEQHHDS